MSDDDKTELERLRAEVERLRKQNAELERELWEMAFKRPKEGPAEGQSGRAN